MAEENKTGLMGLLRDFTGAVSDKEAEFIKNMTPTPKQTSLMDVLKNFTGAASNKEVEFLKNALPTGKISNSVSKDQIFLNMLMNDTEGEVDEEN